MIYNKLFYNLLIILYLCKKIDNVKQKLTSMPIKKIIFLSSLFSLFAMVTSCERIEKQDLQSGLVQQSVTISKEEIQRILSTKVNLESHQVTDELKFSLPDYYYFQTELVESPEFETENTFGKLDFATKKTYSIVELHNSLFVDYSMYDESVYVVKEKNPNLLTIEDVKIDYGSEEIYYEDKNSLVFSSDNSFTTVHFQYDIKSESYLIYTGSISWAKKFAPEEKLDLAFYFLRNAKNLLNTNFSKQEFTWKDYVENRPKIEINLVKNMFGNFEKEMSVFLDENKSVVPRIEDFAFVELYRFQPRKEVEIHEYLNTLNQDRVEVGDGSKWLETLFYSLSNSFYNANYKIIPNGNSTVIEVSKFDEEEKTTQKQFGIVCIINKNNKAFILKNAKAVNEKAVDFYIKMFNYYSNNNSLEVSQKK